MITGLAFLLGAAIAAVDSFASGGEVSPIVIVALLLAGAAIVASFGASRPWFRALVVWVWLPAVHVVKHLLGLPDTLHPNTYASIGLLGGFTLAVTLVGTGLGILLRRLLAAGKGNRDRTTI